MRTDLTTFLVSQFILYVTHYSLFVVDAVDTISEENGDLHINPVKNASSHRVPQNWKLRAYPNSSLNDSCLRRGSRLCSVHCDGGPRKLKIQIRLAVSGLSPLFEEASPQQITSIQIMLTKLLRGESCNSVLMSPRTSRFLLRRVCLTRHALVHLREKSWGLRWKMNNALYCIYTELICTKTCSNLLRNAKD